MMRLLQLLLNSKLLFASTDMEMAKLSRTDGLQFQQHLHSTSNITQEAQAPHLQGCILADQQPDAVRQQKWKWRNSLP